MLCSNCSCFRLGFGFFCGLSPLCQKLAKVVHSGGWPSGPTDVPEKATCQEQGGCRFSKAWGFKEIAWFDIQTMHLSNGVTTVSLSLSHASTVFLKVLVCLPLVARALACTAWDPPELRTCCSGHGDLRGSWHPGAGSSRWALYLPRLAAAVTGSSPTIVWSLSLPSLCGCFSQRQPPLQYHSALRRGCNWRAWQGSQRRGWHEEASLCRCFEICAKTPFDVDNVFAVKSPKFGDLDTRLCALANTLTEAVLLTRASEAVYELDWPILVRHGQKRLLVRKVACSESYWKHILKTTLWILNHICSGRGNYVCEATWGAVSTSLALWCIVPLSESVPTSMQSCVHRATLKASPVAFAYGIPMCSPAPQRETWGSRTEDRARKHRIAARMRPHPRQEAEGAAIWSRVAALRKSARDQTVDARGPRIGRRRRTVVWYGAACRSAPLIRSHCQLVGVCGKCIRDCVQIAALRSSGWRALSDVQQDSV